MSLAGHGIALQGKLPTPGSLNKWLQSTDGYECLDGDCCNLILDAPANIAPTRIRSLGEPLVPFYHTLERLVLDGLIVIAHVRDRHHFVLLTGIDHQNPEAFLVNDPGYNQTSYFYKDIHDVILYDMI